MAAQIEPQSVASHTAPGFVEVPPTLPNPQALSMTDIEVQRQDGARLRLHAPDTTVTAIMLSFLEAKVAGLHLLKQRLRSSSVEIEA